MYKNLGLIFFAGVLVVAGVVIYRSIRSAAEDTTPAPIDVSLEKLRSRNPGFTITKAVFDRAPLFWVTDPKTGSTVMVPWEQSEDAVIEILPCNVSEVPERLLYPHRSEPVCLRLTNDDYVLSAIFFHSSDRLYKVITYYDGPRTTLGAVGQWKEETGRQGRLPDGSMGFLYSYLFYEHRINGTGPADLAAFVGYKRERRAR